MQLLIRCGYVILNWALLYAVITRVLMAQTD